MGWLTLNQNECLVSRKQCNNVYDFYRQVLGEEVTQENLFLLDAYILKFVKCRNKTCKCSLILMINELSICKANSLGYFH